MSTSTQTPQADAAAAIRRIDWGGLLRKYLIVLILAALVVLLTIATEGKFIQQQNLLNIIKQVAPIGIMACGMVFVIITLGIDLSVGSTVAMAAVVSSSLAQTPEATNLMYPGLNVPVFVAILSALAVGAFIGSVNGFLITQFRIAPFISTLGLMLAVRGGAMLYTDGRPVSTLKDAYNFFGSGDILGIPMPLILFLVVVLIASVMLNRTRFGRYTYAIGGNEQAARVSGINIKKVKFFIYTFIGTLAGLAGIVLAGRIGSGNPTLGDTMELDVIAATVIGGTSFAGGIGTIWGAAVGALIIGSINNGLDLLNVSPFMQYVVRGAIIVVAIIIDERKNR